MTFKYITGGLGNLVRHRKRNFSLRTEVRNPGYSPSSKSHVPTSPSSTDISSLITILPNHLTIVTSERQSSAVGVIWKLPAGSRHEDASSIGLSHYLRHALFAGNAAESELALTRRMELRGANLMIGNNRDDITIGIDCPHEGLEGALDSLSKMLLSFRIEAYQFDQIERRVQLDREIAKSDPSAILWDAAFEAAYRSGLGNSPLSCPTVCKASSESIKNFLYSSMTRSGHLLGIDGASKTDIVDIIRSRFIQTYPKLVISSISDAYYGGERRIPHSDGKNRVLIAFGTGGATMRGDSIVADIIGAMIGGDPSILHGQEITHFPVLSRLRNEHEGLSIRAEHVEHSTGGLLGIKISAPNSVPIRPIIETLCKELRNLVITPPSADILMSAKSRAVSRLAKKCEIRLDHAELLASRLYVQSNPFDISSYIQEAMSIPTSDFRSISTKILSRKPVFISLGNLRELPYADEILF